jgi:hypothetical protein
MPTCNLQIANSLPELLIIMAREHDVLVRTSSGGSKVNNRKRAREDEPHGPSKRCPGHLVKEEKMSESANYREQQIRVLQVTRVVTSPGITGFLYWLRNLDYPVEREPRSLSRIVVDWAAGESGWSHPSGLIDLEMGVR